MPQLPAHSASLPPACAASQTAIPLPLIPTMPSLRPSAAVADSQVRAATAPTVLPLRTERAGWSLAAQLLVPAHTGDPGTEAPRGLVVAGHAMMVDHRTLWRTERPSVVGALLEAGFAVLVVDLRGHGHSGPTPGRGGSWRYTDLVDDTEAWLDLANRERHKWGSDVPLAWLGHSLFGHVSLAYFAEHPQQQPDAYVALAVNVWHRKFEFHPVRWQVKRGVMTAATLLANARGKMPAKRLRMGNHDEALGYWNDMFHMATRHGWTLPGRGDWHTGLAQLTLPVLVVSSDGDQWFTHPHDAEVFSAPMPNRTVWRLGPTCVELSLRHLQPSHMGLVTSPASSPLWQAMARWLLVTLAPQTPSHTHATAPLPP